MSGCAYLVSRYPGVTHTFIVGEVRALRGLGVRVETASVRRVGDEEILSAVDREERDSTYALLPATPVSLLRAHLPALARHPRAYLATLRAALGLAHAGGRPRLWQLFYFAEALLLWRWLRARELRHVHVHHANVGADVAMLACRFARATGQPCTWSLTVHGPTELVDVETHKLAAKVADAAAVVCISDFARSQVAAVAAPADLGKLHTVRCGIDVAAFAPVPRPPAGKRILCVSALQRRKGHAVLLDAFARLRAAVPDAELELVGDGPERAWLERRATELGLDGAVRFAGAVGHDRMPERYAAADVFCLPSFSEGVPTVLMEAMATGLAVVATRIAGVPELVADGESGVVVPPARADALADALTRLLGDPELRERLGAAGRVAVQAGYERGASAAALRDVLAPFI